MGAIGGGYLGPVPEIRAATPADAETVFNLLSARSRLLFGSSELSRRLVAAEFALPGFDRWLAVDGNVVLGYGHLAPTQDLVVSASDAAVGDSLLARAEEHARTRGFAKITVETVAEDELLSALVRRAGFTRKTGVLQMSRALNSDLPEPIRPRDVTLRSYRDADGELIHALLDAAYGAWDEHYLTTPHEEWLPYMTEHAEFDPAMWLLAERDGDLVGCALYWREEQRRGWLKDIAVAERERGNGVAQALLLEGFRAYAERGVERVGPKVDAANPTGALELYERAGFVIERHHETWAKPL
jgi:mycothiol synthase